MTASSSTSTTSTTTAGPAVDAIREQVHAMWGGVAAGWAKQTEYVAQRGAVVTEAMLAAVALSAGEHALELACGTGDVGIAAARRVGSTGHVVITDVAPEMVAIAAERASDGELANVSTAVRDIEQIAEPDTAFDVVLCRDGLMFAVEPQRGANEIRRVLRSGGRAAIVVWAERSRNPWLGLVFDAVTDELGVQVPPPGIPGPFSLGEPDKLSKLLGEAGFVDVTIAEVHVPLRAPDFDTWFNRVSMLAGPLARVIGALNPEVRTGLLDRLRRSVAPYTTASGIELPGVALLATATAP